MMARFSPPFRVLSSFFSAVACGSALELNETLCRQNRIAEPILFHLDNIVITDYARFQDAASMSAYCQKVGIGISNDALILASKQLRGRLQFFVSCVRLALSDRLSQITVDHVKDHVSLVTVRQFGLPRFALYSRMAEIFDNATESFSVTQDKVLKLLVAYVTEGDAIADGHDLIEKSLCVIERVPGQFRQRLNEPLVALSGINYFADRYPVIGLGVYWQEEMRKNANQSSTMGLGWEKILPFAFQHFYDRVMHGKTWADVCMLFEQDFDVAVLRESPFFGREKANVQRGVMHSSQWAVWRPKELKWATW